MKPVTVTVGSFSPLSLFGCGSVSSASSLKLSRAFICRGGRVNESLTPGFGTAPSALDAVLKSLAQATWKSTTLRPGKRTVTGSFSSKSLLRIGSRPM